MPGMMYWRTVKGARALPGSQQAEGGVVDRLEDRAAIQRHPGRLDKMAKFSTWDGITPYGSTGWGSFSEGVWVLMDSTAVSLVDLEATTN